MIIRATAKTDIGRARERNEDAFLVRDPLFAVADGMGGHRGGDVASSYALDIISDSGTGDGEETAPLPRLVRQRWGGRLPGRCGWASPSACASTVTGASIGA